MTQEQKILNMLADGEWHCPTVELYMKDDRARISGLKKKGYMIDGSLNCTNSDHHHTSPVKLRRLVSSPETASTNEIANKFLLDFAPKKVEQPSGMMF